MATNSGGLQPGALTTGALDTVVSFASQPGHHTVQLLGLIAAALKPGGKLVVQEVRTGGELFLCTACSLHPALVPEPGTIPLLLQDGTSEAALSKLLLLSGLASSGAAPGGGVAAIKPTWETGARASIALKPRQSNGGGKPAAAAAWKLAADDEEGDDELLDDEELLTEEDKQRPAPPPGATRAVPQGPVPSAYLSWPLVFSAAACFQRSTYRTAVRHLQRRGIGICVKRSCPLSLHACSRRRLRGWGSRAQGMQGLHLRARGGAGGAGDTDQGDAGEPHERRLRKRELQAGCPPKHLLAAAPAAASNCRLPVSTLLLLFTSLWTFLPRLLRGDRCSADNS